MLRGLVKGRETVTDAVAGRRLLLAVLPAAFSNHLFTVMFTSSLAVVAAEFATSVAVLGQVQTTMMAMATVLGLVIGPLAERFGYKRSLLVALFAVALGGLVVGTASDLAALFLAALFAALGRALLAPVAYAIVSTRLPADAARLAISRVVMAVAAGVVLGAPILTSLADVAGWRGGFLGLAALACLAAALVWRLLSPDGGAERRGLSPRALLSSYRLALAEGRPLLGLYVGGMLRNVVAWGTTTYAGALLVQRYDLPIGQVGLAITAMGLGLMAGSYLVGGRLGSLPPRMLLALLYLAAGALMVAFLVITAEVWLAVALLGFGWVFTGSADALEPLLLGREARGARVTALLLQGSSYSLASALGAGLGGLLILLGGYPTLGFGLGGLTVLSAASLLLFRPTPSTGS